MLWPGWQNIVEYGPRSDPRQADPHNIFAVACAYDRDRLYTSMVGESLEDASDILDERLAMAGEGSTVAVRTRSRPTPRGLQLLLDRVSAPAIVSLVLAAWLAVGCLAAPALGALLRRRRIELERAASAYRADANSLHGERLPSVFHDAAGEPSSPKQPRPRPSWPALPPPTVRRYGRPLQTNRTQGGSHPIDSGSVLEPPSP